MPNGTTFSGSTFLASDASKRLSRSIRVHGNPILAERFELFDRDERGRSLVVDRGGEVEASVPIGLPRYEPSVPCTRIDRLSLLLASEARVYPSRHSCEAKTCTHLPLRDGPSRLQCQTGQHFRAGGKRDSAGMLELEEA
jgi:hypothetical protein